METRLERTRKLIASLKGDLMDPKYQIALSDLMELYLEYEQAQDWHKYGKMDFSVIYFVVARMFTALEAISEATKYLEEIELQLSHIKDIAKERELLKNHLKGT